MNKLMMLALACVCARAGFAVEAVWTNDTVGALNYVTLGNWKDRSTGGPLAVAPTNSGDHAWLDVVSNSWRTINLPGVQGKAQNFGTIHGSWHSKLVTANPSGNTTKSLSYTFDDLSDYEGTISIGRLGPAMSFSGTSTSVRLADHDASLRPSWWIPTVTTATIDALHGFGRLILSGGGAVTVKESVASDHRIIDHRAGKLTLEGRVADAPLAPVGDPVFWVDASNDASLDVAAPDANGRRLVSAWRDCRFADGVHTVKATPTGVDGVSSPWIATNPVVNRAVVDFGTLSGTDPFGPKAALKYTLPANVREMFYVWKDNGSSAPVAAFPVGQDGSYSFHRGYNGELYAGDASAVVKNGILRLDGANAATGTKPEYATYHLLHVALVDAGAKPNTFFRDRTVRYGGGRLAEVLFYTNTLTQVQRAHVEKYLQDKWFGMTAECAVLRTSGASAKVEVPEGRVATVRQAVIDATTLTKTGAGTLKVGRFQPGAATIDVAGGAVGFDKDLTLAPTNAPADGAVIWLDATAKDCFEYKGEPEGGTNFITKWKDCRSTSTAYASRMTSWNHPFVSFDTCNGKRVVDFGEMANAANKAAMSFSCGDVICEAFQVVKLHVKNSQQNVFGCSGQDLLRENTSTPLHTSFAYLSPSAGLWTFNGEAVDPWRTYAIDKDTWYVASFANQGTCNCIYMANERNSKIGDQRVGEFIGYRRRLTDAERKQTVAYLMKKWKDADTAFTQPPAAIKKMNFTAENDAPKVLADVDTRIESVTFDGQTSFEKTGAGKLAVGNDFPCTVSDYAITGDCTVKGNISAFPDAALHCDASRLDTFTFRAGQEADKRIDKWYDCRGNGKYAKCNFDNSRTNAVLKSTGPDGEGGVLANMPYVDFGTGSSLGGMYWFGSNNAQLKLTTTREYHVVFMITGNGNRQPIGGPDYPGTASLTPYGGEQKEMFYSGCTRARAALKKMDGSDWYRSNYWQPSQKALSKTTFYVHSFAATNSVSAYSFAIDRGNCGSGDIKLCEAIVFTGNTNTTARAEAIHAYLMKKWKGLGTNPISIELDKVEIAAGGSLSLTSSVPFSVASVAGGGTLSLGGQPLQGLSSVGASFDAAGQVAGTTVPGDVTFAPNVTVRVKVANPKAIGGGTYTVFAADELTNVDDVTFDLQVENPGRKSYQLVKTATALKVKVIPPGLTVIVR